MSSGASAYEIWDKFEPIVSYLFGYLDTMLEEPQDANLFLKISTPKKLNLYYYLPAKLIELPVPKARFLDSTLKIYVIN